MNLIQANAMLAMQDRMNTKVNPQWVSAGYAWTRAIAVEGVEAMGHFGWKWWKQQTPDIEQFKIELVDIWHFALSHMMTIQRSGAAESIVDEVANPVRRIVFECKLYDMNAGLGMGMLSKLDLLVGMATTGRFSISVFSSIMDEINMTWDELYTGYVAKNVLNFFRQDNGYKSGTYIKLWDGKEDNVHLSHLVNILDSGSPTFETDLYQELAWAYRAVLEHHGRVTEAANLSTTPT